MSHTHNTTFLEHLMEIRRRLLLCVFAVMALFILLFSFSQSVYHLFAIPLLSRLPQDSHMIATAVASPFLTPLKLVFILAIFCSIPVILYHFWMFVAPALYHREKRLIFPLLVASTGLFYAGVAFAYFITLPLIFGFFTHIAPEGVVVMPDMSEYLDFTLKLLFAFGAAFEVPIVIVTLVGLRIVRIESLTRKRPYVIVLAFVVGMLLTPPDVISQILLAIPLWILYEVGVGVSRLLLRSRS